MHGAAARSLVGCPVWVRWPQHEVGDAMVDERWHLGHVTGRATHGEFCAGGDELLATFTVAYCHDDDRPGVPTHHDHHLLSAERYAVDEGATVWSWVLLAPMEVFVAGQMQGTRGCGWPGCPGSSMRFSPTRLLQHARHAHGGQLDDERLRWASGLRCATCAQPFCAAGLRQHYRLDPADGVRRCPSQFRSVGPVASITPADEAFVRGLTADEVYVQTVPSLIEIGTDSSVDVGAIVAPLISDTVAAPSDAYRHRLLHVVLVALLRPLGAQQNRRQVLATRCSRLRVGGELEALWREVCPRRQRPSRVGAAAAAAAGVANAAAGADDGTRRRPPPTADEIRRRRAVAFMHAAEVSAARSALESTSHLGELRRADVLTTGLHGEVVTAVEGSIPAEMLGKHPAPGPDDEDLPTLEELMREAAVGAEAPQTREEIRRRVTEMFDLESFRRYVGRRPRRRMSGCDMIRFEHAAALCRAGYAGAVRDLVLMYALGDIPDEARPYGYGGRLVAPSKPGGTDHRPLGAGVTWRRLAAGFFCERLSGDFGAEFGPLQLGVGVRHGTEIFATTVRLALESHPTWVACKLDFANAFNSCSRIAFLRYAAQHFPALVPFLLAAYGVPAYITALGPEGWVRFLSRRGSTQGCPLGPFAFAACIQPVLREVHAAFPDVCLAAIHDDVQLVGEPPRVLLALRMLVERSSVVCGLTPTGHKFGIYAPAAAVLADDDGAIVEIEQAIASWTSFAALAAGHHCVATSEGFVTGGAPIGSPAFVRAFVLGRLRDHALAHSELACLRDTQAAYLLLRYSLAVRVHYLLRLVGDALAPHEEGPQAPLWVHDAQLSASLAVLLVDPTLDPVCRQAQAVQGLPRLAVAQAGLPAKAGGLSLLPASSLWAVARLAGAMAVRPYLIEHADAFCLPASALSTVSTLTYYSGLRAAFTELHLRSARSTVLYPDFTSLLSGSPVSQHDLAEGVFVDQFLEVVVQQPSEAMRARLYSAAGLHAGAWLGTFPVTCMTTVRARHWQLAMLVRLGGAIPELMPVAGVTPLCGGCSQQHDSFGFHPGICRVGNRRGLWTIRHDAVETMLAYVIRRMGRQCHVVSRGAGHWFGAAAFRPGSTRARRADLVVPGHQGMGRHLFLDVAVTDAASGGALDARPSSAASCGVAAARRALQKTQKYGPLAAGVSSDFCPAVMERLGTMCDELAGLIRMLCGDGERDRMRHDDVTFSHSSRSTYMAGMIGLAVVVADAMMLDTVLGLDVRGDDARATPGAPRVGREGGGAWMEPAPEQREVEGRGGAFWYEVPH